VVLKKLPACAAKSFPVLLEALLDGIVAIRHLLSAKPRRIVRASLLLLRGAGLRSRRATSQNQDGNCYQNDSAHLLLLRDMICDQPTPRRMTPIMICGKRVCRRLSRSQCVRVYFTFGEVGQHGIGPPLFLETQVQHLLLVAQIQLAGERAAVPYAAIS